MKFRLKLFTVLSFGVLLTACGNEVQEATDTSSMASEATTSSIVASSSASSSESISEEMITVMIAFEEDGEPLSELAQTLEVEKGSTLMEVMKENYEVEESGGFISSIEGHEQNEEDGKYWLYTVSGEEIMVGAADYELQPGDEVLWTLNAFQSE